MRLRLPSPPGCEPAPLPLSLSRPWLASKRAGSGCTESSGHSSSMQRPLLHLKAWGSYCWLAQCGQQHSSADLYSILWSITVVAGAGSSAGQPAWTQPTLAFSKLANIAAAAVCTCAPHRLADLLQVSAGPSLHMNMRAAGALLLVPAMMCHALQVTLCSSTRSQADCCTCCVPTVKSQPAAIHVLAWLLNL